MKYLRRYKWYRNRDLGFGRIQSVIGTIWYFHGKLRDRHFKKIRRSYDLARYTAFPPGKWRIQVCAKCRKDKGRQEVAEVLDAKGEEMVAKGIPCQTVQFLKCKRCGERKAWWHFAKMPMNETEDLEVANHGGKAW